MLIAERLGDPTALQEAQLSFQAAIDTIPRRRLPREWAAAQNKLGLVLYKLDYADPSSDVTRLSLAISSFQLAMQVYTRVDAPRRWAEIMNNYAQAAQVMGQQFQDSEMLQKAILACRSSLEVRQRSKTPMLWAATQNTLGSALFLLGKQIDRIDHLEAAIDAFRSAHAVYAAKGAHKMAQVITRNLAHVNVLIERRKDSDTHNSYWFDETEIAVSTPDATTVSEDEVKQWWIDTVAVTSSPESNGAELEYRHPSGDMDLPEPAQKVSNAAE